MTKDLVKAHFSMCLDLTGPHAQNLFIHSPLVGIETVFDMNPSGFPIDLFSEA
jgi:hypothetical protein